MKKEAPLLTLLLLLTLACSALATYEFKHHQNVTNAAVVKAQTAETTAKAALTASQLNLKSVTSQNQTLAQDKLTLCTQLKTTKLTNAICQ